VDVLTDSGLVGIMTRDNGFETVPPGLVDLQVATVAITVEIVQTLIIGLPDLNRGVRYDIAACVDDLSRERERQAGVAGRTQDIADRRQPLVKRTQRIGWSRLAKLLFTFLEGFENRVVGKVRRDYERTESKTLLKNLATR
jgi:hypothetical protein